MSENITLNLQISIPKRWVNKFLQMLDCMKWCGNVGASRTVAFYADGDGDFRPKFKINTEWEKTPGIWRKDRDRPLPGMEVYYDAG